MDLISKYEQIAVEDSTNMFAYTVFPKNMSKLIPGLILFQEAFGVNSYIKKLAHRFAEEGFAVIAPELFHRTAAKGFEISYSDFKEAQPHLSVLTPQNIELDVLASYKWLSDNASVQNDNISSIGFCLGGKVSFIANSILPFKASVSFYGGGISSPDIIKRAEALGAPMLFFWGGLDKHITLEHIDMINNKLKDSGKPYTSVVISYADHGFFCDERSAYNAQASIEARALTLSFLKSRAGII